MIDEDRPSLFRPLGYFVTSLALTSWNLFGCYLCYLQVRYRISAVGREDPVQRAMFEAIPFWVDIFSMMAVGGGFLGGLCLLLKARGPARALLIVSLIGYCVQFAYVLFVAGMLEIKGPAQALPGPLFITGIALFALIFAWRASAGPRVAP